MNCSNPLTFTVLGSLPNGWLDQDLGQVATAGSASYANGVFTVSASGQWIYSTADGMHFVYQPLNGDGTIVARVVSTSGTPYPEAGVMIRETLTANSAHAFMAYEPYPSASTYFYWRPSTGASTSSSPSAIPALPYWVKLVRSGSTFSGYISADGANWVQVGATQTISMAQNVYIGLAVSGNDNNTASANVNFDNVAHTP
jgi:regulation of enolase protein 1 (concanavalin A-like superfamily)